MVFTYFLDIDECSPHDLAANYSHYAHNCHADANCSNTKGSFYCTCHVGYSGNGVTCLGRFPLDWTKMLISATFSHFNSSLNYNLYRPKRPLKF